MLKRRRDRLFSLIEKLNSTSQMAKKSGQQECNLKKNLNGIKMTKNIKKKVLRNFTIPTYHVIEARRPDTVVLSKTMDHMVVRD